MLSKRRQIVDRLQGLSFDAAVARLTTFDSYDRSPALALVLSRAPTSACCLRAYLEWGCVCDARWLNRSSIAECLRKACAEVLLADFLTPEPRCFYDALANIVEIWRGCERGRERGLSWTTDRAVAEGFAAGRRCVNKVPTLLRAEIPKQHIFAVFVERMESEIVVDPRRLRALQRLPIASKAEIETAGQWSGGVVGEK